MATVNIDLETEGVVKKALVNRLYHEIDELNREISKLRYYKRVDINGEPK